MSAYWDAVYEATRCKDEVKRLLSMKFADGALGESPNISDLEGEGQCSRSIRPRNSNYSDWFSDTKTALRKALVA